LLLKRLEPAEVTALYTLEHLAWEFNTAAVAYRRVGKGAVLRVSDGLFDTPADVDAEELIQLNDIRAEHYRLFSPTDNGGARDGAYIAPPDSFVNGTPSKGRCCPVSPGPSR